MRVFECTAEVAVDRRSLVEREDRLGKVTEETCEKREKLSFDIQRQMEFRTA